MSFGYNQQAPVLQHVPLEIHAGEILALVGPSGAGKSTILNLIPRFYDPTGGSIRDDGYDLRNVTQSSLREQIGIVPQETILFGGSIRENILYGRLDASEAEMIEAARAAESERVDPDGEPFIRLDEDAVAGLSRPWDWQLDD